MLEVISSLKPNSKAYNLEKIKWVTADNYTRSFGMSIPEAFVSLAMTFYPSTDEEIVFHFETYNQARQCLPEDEQWMLDVNTVDSIITLFQEEASWLPPTSVLLHLFPPTQYCEDVFRIVHEKQRAES